MKTRLLGFVIGALLAGGATMARADLEVSASVRVRAVAEFHAPLAAHGTWVEVRGHGNCWRPSGVAVDWRPYCVGQWVWTDCGWYWESDEPWAWSCYHYGWWVVDPVLGWVWVPGIEWAPAWVSWRVGGGYCGWAPLAPHGVVIRETAFVFVQERRFHERVQPTTVIVNNTSIIKNTTVVNVKRESRTIAGARQTVVVNEGPKVASIENVSGQKFVAKPIQEVAMRTEAKAPDTVRRQHGTRDAEKPKDAERPRDSKPDGDNRKPDSVPRTAPDAPRTPDTPRAVPGAHLDKVVPPPKGEPETRPHGEKGNGRGKPGKPPSKPKDQDRSQGKDQGKDQGRDQGKGPDK
jgi:hypothetical protein